MKLNPDARAFPSILPKSASELCDQTGLTVREHFAAMAMQGLLAARNGFMVDIGTVTAGDYAVRCADSLIEALNRPVPVGVPQVEEPDDDL